MSGFITANAVYLCFGTLFFAAFILNIILVPLIRRICIRINFIDRPGERKIHEKPTPYGGGIAIYLSFMAVFFSVFAALKLKPQFNFAKDIFESIAPYLDGLGQQDTVKKTISLIAGSSGIFLLGLFDDKFKLNSKLKLFFQIVCAVIIFSGGIRISFFIDNFYVKLLITVLWVVGITNAFNLLDNMDGLSSGVAFIASIIFLIIAAGAGQVLLSGMLCILAGAILGFLPFNFFPARIFMGDAGSLFLGFMLAAISISGTYYSEGKTVISAVMPVVVLCIPIFDTFSVIAIRIKNKKPLMVGDKNHFSHRLNRLGMTKRESVLTIYLLSATLGISAIMLSFTSNFGGFLILMHTMAVLTVIALLEVAASRRGANSGDNDGEK